MLNDIAFEMTVHESAEVDRFRSIVKRYLHAHGPERDKLRSSLLKWLKYDPSSDTLIDDFIRLSVASTVDGRLDSAIDVLNQLGHPILRYAEEYLINDIRQWNLHFPGRAYEPNDEYWYILLRSVGQSVAVPGAKLALVKMCCTANARGIWEAVIEALADIGTTESFREIEKFQSDEDPFIASLASELLNAR